MSVIAAVHVPVAMVDSGEEQFLDESRLIAESFLSFYLQDFDRHLLSEKSPDGEASDEVASKGTKQASDKARIVRITC